MNILLWNNNFSSQVWQLKTENLLRLQWYQWDQIGLGKSQGNPDGHPVAILFKRQLIHSKRRWMSNGFCFLCCLILISPFKVFPNFVFKKHIVSGKFYFSSMQAPYWLKVFSVILTILIQSMKVVCNIKEQIMHLPQKFV